MLITDLLINAVAAAVAWGAGEAPVIEEIEVDPPGYDEVRLKMICASLCHTDVMFNQGFALVSIYILFSSFMVCSDFINFDPSVYIR